MPLFKKKAGGTKIGNLLRKVSTVATKVVSVASDVPYAPVLIFKPMMVKKLAAKGVSHNNTLRDIAQKFAKHVVGHGFVQYGSEPMMYDESNNVVDDVAEGVVKAILNYIKELLSKKKSGQKLSPEESEIVAESETASSGAVTNIINDESSFGDMVKDFVFGWKGGVTLMVLIVGWAVLSSKPKK